MLACQAMTKGHASVVKLAHQWFPLLLSEELGRSPVAATLQETPLVLFRDGEGKAHALLDRCPHRNVPLSLGKVAADGTLECRYHGWRFAGDGDCTFIPSLPILADEPKVKARCATAYSTREQQGMIWVYSTPDVEPRRDPHRFALEGAPGYGTVKQVVSAKGTLYSTIENALDVPHTAFLHRGLFRAESRNLTITAKVRRAKDRVEVEYLGEPRPPGIVAKILSPSGGMVTHYDRFILPGIAQVEYRIGDENHLLVDSVMTPVSDFETKIFAVVSFKTRIPAKMLEPLIKPLALQIFKQDAFILDEQTRAIERFGGEQFAWTDIDVVGKHVWRLLREAERGDPQGSETLSDVGEVQLVV
jgi:phenylpropionate dioxygenase-like ring-hydroxylating dioxygenase large terminal subunit